MEKLTNNSLEHWESVLQKQDKNGPNQYIVRALNVPGEGVIYFMKEIGSITGQHFSACQAKEIWLQMVISFYQEEVQWDFTLPTVDGEHEYPRQLQAEKIKSVAFSCTGEMLFLMTWTGLKESRYVLASEANKRCPQIVVEFYEERVHCSGPWTPENGPIGFHRLLNPEQILEAKMNSGKKYFLMKWTGSNVPDFVRDYEAAEKCPHLVIEFYERQVEWFGQPPLEPRGGWKLKEFFEGMDAEEVLGATEQAGETIFLMKWKNSDKTNFVRATEAKMRFFEVVIAFYASNCRWNSPNKKGEKMLLRCELTHISEKTNSWMS